MRSRVTTSNLRVVGTHSYILGICSHEEFVNLDIRLDIGAKVHVGLITGRTRFVPARERRRTPINDSSSNNAF